VAWHPTAAAAAAAAAAADCSRLHLLRIVVDQSGFSSAERRYCIVHPTQ